MHGVCSFQNVQALSLSCDRVAFLGALKPSENSVHRLVCFKLLHFMVLPFSVSWIRYKLNFIPFHEDTFCGTSHVRSSFRILHY